MIELIMLAVMILLCLTIGIFVFEIYYGLTGSRIALLILGAIVVVVTCIQCFFKGHQWFNIPRSPLDAFLHQNIYSKQGGKFIIMRCSRCGKKKGI